MNQRIFRSVVGSLFVLIFLGLSLETAAQPLPSPADFVRNLDVRCYQIPNQPAINVPLVLTHLNPVFQQMGLPPEIVVLGPPRNL